MLWFLGRNKNKKRREREKEERREGRKKEGRKGGRKEGRKKKKVTEKKKKRHGWDCKRKRIQEETRCDVCTSFPFLLHKLSIKKCHGDNQFEYSCDIR